MTAFGPNYNGKQCSGFVALVFCFVFVFCIKTVSGVTNTAVPQKELTKWNLMACRKQSWAVKMLSCWNKKKQKSPNIWQWLLPACRYTVLVAAVLLGVPGLSCLADAPRAQCCWVSCWVSWQISAFELCLVKQKELFVSLASGKANKAT